VSGGAALLVLMMTSGAQAQGAREACENDAMRLCGQYVPDQGRITACMSARRRYLSPACRAIFEGGARRKTRRRDD
jgi:hypothetical protein